MTFAAFDLSDRARDVVRSFDALTDGERAGLAGTRQVTTPRALAVLGRIGELSEVEWLTLSRLVDAIRGRGTP
jgi:hypothetical protein